MLRTNLSTRPFYNERIVRLVLGALAAGVLLALAVGVTRLVVLSGRQAGLGDRLATTEQRARQLQRDAQQIRRGISRPELEAVTAAARDANALIERRVFSWTTLFSTFEETLPADLRIISVKPGLDRQGRLRVALTVIGRRAEDVGQFIEQLEGTGAFADVLSRQERLTNEGLLEVTLEGRYVGFGSGR